MWTHVMTVCPTSKANISEAELASDHIKLGFNDLLTYKIISIMHYADEALSVTVGNQRDYDIPE